LTTGSTSLLPPGTTTTKLQVAALTLAATVLEPSCRLGPTVLVRSRRTLTGWQQQS
jgi:hypothetical protein